MIEFPMSVKEIYDNLAKDLEKVKYQRNKLLSKVVREFKKTKRYPVFKTYEYNIPSTNNKYIIGYYASNITELSQPIITTMCVLGNDDCKYMLDWGAVLYKHTDTRPLDFVRQVRFYSKHFIDRYRERFLKDDALSDNDVICIYASRNIEFIPLKVNEGINANYKRYGEAGANAFRVNDGVCFQRCYTFGKESVDGDRNNDIVDSIGIEFKTFVDSDTLKKEQKMAIDEEHEHCLIETINFLKEEIEMGNKDLSFTLSK